MKILQPADWKPARGYSNGILAEGKLIFIAGQIGWDNDGKIVSASLVEQTAQALKNIVRILKEGGANPGHVARLTWYICDKNEYLKCQKEIGATYRAVFGRHYPAMTLVEVSNLLETGALVEIEATAVIPKECS